jgi:hypothetical protein
MKTTLRYAVVILALLLMVFSVMTAQPLRVEGGDKAIVRGKIAVETVQLLLSTAEAALNQYNNRASLIDIASGKVSGRSTSAFRDLFVDNPDVYNDLSIADTTPVKARDYASQAYNSMREVGVGFALEKPRFEFIEYDSAGFYRVGIRVFKLLKNGINEKKTLVTFPINRPHKFELLFRFEINQKQLLAAKISDIHGKEIRLPIPSSKMTLNFGLGLFNPGQASFTSDLAGESLIFNSNAATSFGLSLLRPLVPEKNLLAGLGLAYTTQELTMRIDTFGVATVKDNTKLIIRDFIEEGKLKGLDLSLGLGLRKKLGDKIQYGAMAWMVGTLPMASSATLAYRLSYRTTDRLKQKYKQLTEEEKQVSVNNTPQFRLGMRINPFVNYHFNEVMGVQLDASYHLMLNKIYATPVDGERFFDQFTTIAEQNSASEIAGAISTNLENLKFNSIGLRLAFIYEISK